MAESGRANEKTEVTDQRSCRPETATLSADYLAGLLVAAYHADAREELS
jgi:hypothetical protein